MNSIKESGQREDEPGKRPGEWVWDLVEDPSGIEDGRGCGWWQAEWKGV